MRAGAEYAGKSKLCGLGTRGLDTTCSQFTVVYGGAVSHVEAPRLSHKKYVIRSSSPQASAQPWPEGLA